MSIFPTTDTNDVLIIPTGPQFDGLRTTLTALMDAHSATSGCKPNYQQINALSYHSGAAVTAIMQALGVSARQYAEEQH